MLTQLLAPSVGIFHSHSEIEGALERACREAPGVARFDHFGASEAGRPLYAAVIGRGERRIALAAGAHAEEPVGPETLRHFIRQMLRRPRDFAPLLDRFTFIVIPHVNPDAEAANRPWLDRWPDPAAFIRHAIRELPGRDVEFGYPAMRAENRAVSEFLRPFAPLSLYVNLHGMSFADGAMLLIERHWIDRTHDLRRRYTAALTEHDVSLFDWDRHGDKGFIYIDPGFMSSPEGAAMQRYFNDRGDHATASQFHLSSMEWLRSLGGDPLCLVTELPLFVITRDIHGSAAGEPTTYLRFRESLPRLRLMLQRGEPIDDELGRYGVRPLDLAAAMTLQLQAVELGIDAVSA